MYGDIKQAKQLFEGRLAQYRRALVQVSLAGDESPDDVAERVVKMLREAPCAI